MGKNHFTEEQQNELHRNPYFQKVSATSITYTTEFKERFEVEYRAGKLLSQILVEWESILMFLEMHEGKALYRE